MGEPHSQSRYYYNTFSSDSQQKIQVSGLLAQNKGGAIMQIVYIPANQCLFKVKKMKSIKDMGKT